MKNKSNDTEIGIEKLRSHNLKVKFFPQEKENLEFYLILDSQYNIPERIKYVEDKIQKLDSLMKYKNLKVVVESTSKYLKMKQKIELKYITELHKYFSDKSIKYILNSQEYQKFISIDRSLKN